MLRHLWIVLLALTITACANPQLDTYNYWMQNALERAERGEIKWSDYYQGCFSRLVDVHGGVRNRLLELEYYNALIGYSQQYESGKINKSDFDQKRRSAQLAHVKREEDMRHNIYQPGASADTAGDIYPH